MWRGFAVPVVEQQKPLEGDGWTTGALYLQGISLVRRNNEWHHFDPLGTAGVITNGSASVISNNLYDLFRMKRYEQGSAETPWRWKLRQEEEEGLIAYPPAGYVLAEVGVQIAKTTSTLGIDIDWDRAKSCLRSALEGAISGCLAGAGPYCGPCIVGAVPVCIIEPPACGAVMGLCKIFCSGQVLHCIWGAIVGGAANFLKCYHDCVNKKKQRQTDCPMPMPVQPVRAGLSTM